MNIEPISKEIYDKAKELGIETITLRFSGGNDEGYLDVEVYPYDLQGKLDSEIDTWAWDAYQYNGAGDGNDYGDDITYNLKDGKVSLSSWCMTREESDEGESDLQIVEEEE